MRHLVACVCVLTFGLAGAVSAQDASAPLQGRWEPAQMDMVHAESLIVLERQK